MKQKIITTLLCCLLICAAFTQTVYKNYIDGEIYFKIKKQVPFRFDTLISQVEMQTKLPFLIPLIHKYNISKTEASFYFSKSDILKRTFRLYFNNSKQVDHIIKDLQSLPEIEYAERIPLIKLDYTPNDLGSNSYSGQYALYKINAQNAWDVSRGDASTLIAIVDDAEDVNHTDLYINVIKKRDVSDNDDNPEPPRNDNGWEHGTHTSGIACATTNNSIGIASIGFNCGLMAIKATPDVTANDSGNYIYNGYEGISWAVQNGAKVISCSWGDNTNTTQQNVIDDAYNNDVLVVASAGNSNNTTKNYPAAYNHVLSVAATDINDQKASFSSYGTWVSVSAPGVNIYSTFPGNTYNYLSGTSMSAPLVAGLCGLVRSVNPSLSVDQVISIIKNTSDNIDSQNPTYIGLLGSGRINAYNAVESALPCNASINLGTGPYSVPKTESSGSITSGNLILGNTAVIFDAASTVDIVPGFHASNGSSFHAYIDGCGNKFAGNESDKKNKNSRISNSIENNSANTISSNFLNVYPNPASSIIHLDFTTNANENNVVVNVFNSEMKQVKELKIGVLIKGKQSISLNLNNLPSGIYFVTVQLQLQKLVTKVSLIK